MLNVLLVEPYYGGSHKAWADGYVKHSHHHINLLSLPAQFWKWRMQGGAVSIARMLQEQPHKPDVMLVSDMLDLSLLRALLSRGGDKVPPIGLYFHENQLTYPQNRRQTHGWQYGFINYASALAADSIFFNSQFHLDNFFDELPRMLKHFGDFNELQTISHLREKSAVLPLGLDLQRYDPFADAASLKNTTPLILWNHRWEADKNATAFFEALDVLIDEGLEFRVAITGENFRQNPTEFEAARQQLGRRVVQFGYVESFAAYADLLWRADYVVSSAYQDFFGISVTEAIYCQCLPILPKRLNYPDLIPEAFHQACLYREGALTGLLRAHLQGNFNVDIATLKQNVAQYDWTTMAPIYDAALEKLRD